MPRPRSAAPQPPSEAGRHPGDLRRDRRDHRRDARSVETADRARVVRRPASGRTPRAAPLRCRRGRGHDRRDAEGRQGGHRGCRCLSQLWPRISAPKTGSGLRIVHVPPPFLSMLQKHLLEHTAEGPNGLLFPGDRTDHMSVRYLMARYRPARSGRSTGPDHPPPAPHGTHHRRPARGHGRRAPSSRRPCLAGSDGDLPARNARPRQVLAEKIGETYDAWVRRSK